MRLLKKTSSWDACTRLPLDAVDAFNTLKSILMEMTLLHYVKLGRGFILDVDMSSMLSVLYFHNDRETKKFLWLTVPKP